MGYNPFGPGGGGGGGYSGGGSTFTGDVSNGAKSWGGAFGGGNGSGLAKYDPTVGKTGNGAGSDPAAAALGSVPKVGNDQLNAFNWGGGGVVAPTIAMTPQMQAATLQLDPTNNAFRGGQTNAMNYFGGIANGSMPSPSQLALSHAMSQNVAGQFALANSGPMSGHAMGLRGALNNAGVMGTQAATQGAILAGQDRLNAAQAMGNLGTQGYGQDIQSATANAGFQNDANKTNYIGQNQTNIEQGKLQQGADQLKQKYISMGMDADKANQQAWVDMQKLISGGYLGRLDANAKASAAHNSMLGGLLGGLGTMAAAGISAGGKGGGGGGGSSGGDQGRYGDGDTSSGSQFDNSKTDQNNSGGDSSTNPNYNGPPMALR